MKAKENKYYSMHPQDNSSREHQANQDTEGGQGATIKPKYRFKKLIASFLLMLTVLSPATFIGISAVTTASLIAPQPANAQFTDFLAAADRFVSALLKLILEGLITAGKIGIKNALRSFLEKIAYDTAVWLGSGDKNQKPLLFTDEVGQYLLAAGDAALGEFLNALAAENGFLEFNLCDLPTLEKLQIQLILPQIIGKEPYTPDCSFSEISKSVSEYADTIQAQAAAFMSDPSSLVDFSVSLDSGENALSSLLNAADEAIGAEVAAERNAELERLKSDFKDAKADVSGYIETPSGIIEMQTNATVSQTTQAEITQTDNIFADALSVFYTTLASKFLERMTSGFMTFFTTTSVADSESGASATASAKAGRSGAEDRFSDFKTVSFSKGTQVQILSHFANCPTDGMEFTNCVVNEPLRLAIEEGLTIQQAIDQGILDPNIAFGMNSDGTLVTHPEQGISLRAAKILKAYSVVPVGWVLALEYNQSFDGNPMSLQNALDEFDQCGEGEYSPYCGLVDPHWVLKAPEVFCELEGYGGNTVIDQHIPSDGSDYTPEEHLVTRLQSCIDIQSCLSEDDDGFCKANSYGYCTKQKDIYRFQGDSCPAYSASCEFFTASDDTEVAFLTNTLNYNDCTVDSIGCQWYCTEYNEVNEAFRCVDQDTLYTECDNADGCTCTYTYTDGSTENCTVDDGGFYCETSTSDICTLGTESESTTGVDAAITFDNDYSLCDEDDSGCHEFIPVKGGANLLSNASFEYFNGYRPYASEEGVLTDPADAWTTTNQFGYQADAETPCSRYNTTQDCYGWEQKGTFNIRAVDESLFSVEGDEVGLQIQGLTAGTPGDLISRFDTGQPLADRSFSLTFGYQNDSSTTCTGQYFIRPNGSTASEYSVDIEYETGSGFTQIDAEPVTFNTTITEETVEIGFTQPTGCDVILDGVKLEENYGSSGVEEYANDTDLVYYNTSEMASCEVENVNCHLYTPSTGESDIPVPGIITNPFSDICGGGDADYTDIECSQCKEEYVGCDFYVEVPFPYNGPIRDVTGFDYPLTDISEETREAIAQRTGYYCNDGNFTPCNPDLSVVDECGSTSYQCLPSISIIPTTGQTCAAQYVGCEQYVNLNVEQEGGESIEYYSYIKQCVTPSTDQIDSNEVGIYYTFEGSDVSGYTIQSWYLKKSDDEDTNGNGAPCTYLDLYGETSQTPESECLDVENVATDCTLSDEDPDCTEYYDSDGNVYYRNKSETITVSEDCQGLRNSEDGRVYYSIPSESTTCPSNANQCREYQGSQGSNVSLIISENFDTDTWTDGEASSTVITAGVGYSLAFGTGITIPSSTATTDVSGSIDEDASYVVSFWAKGGGDRTVKAFFKSDLGGVTSYFDNTGVTVSDEWESYTIGPYIFDEESFGAEYIGDEVFGFEYNASTVYIDNVELRDSDSYYLIQGTADTCQDYEGCEQYSDEVDGNHYLKSFENLCEEEYVGCLALIDTQNSDVPYYENYNDSNEFDEDDVPVTQDAVVTLVTSSNAECSAEVVGCSQYGLPDLDAAEDVQSFTSVYLVNEPDDYDTILCEEQQRSCEEWVDAEEQAHYFKDPDDKYCTYDTTNGQWIDSDGNTCPLQNESSGAAPSQPKGAICNDGLRAGDLCGTDSDCPYEDGTYARCQSNIGDDSGWVGVCDEGYSGCTLYVDPDTDAEEIFNGNFETDVVNNFDQADTVPDGLPDEWEVDNDGESGLGAGIEESGAVYIVSDVTATTVEGSTLSSVLYFYSESDPGTGLGRTNGQTYDDGAELGSPAALLVGGAEAGFTGFDEAYTVTITTDNTSYSSLTFNLPQIDESDLDDDSYPVFYIDTTGQLYWADSDHNGLQTDYSDLLSSGQAINDAHVVSDYAIGNFEINGFYDAMESTGTIGCETFTQVSDADSPVFEEHHAVKLGPGTSSDHCIIFADDYILVDEDAMYTLSANVYTPDADNTFAIGLLFYDESINELRAGSDPEDYAIAAYEGDGWSEDTRVLSENEWMRFYSTIGPNLVHDFPSGTYYVKPFIEVGDDAHLEDLYFDNISLSKNEEYTYLNYSVDGTPEGDTDSCAGTVSIDEGCVAFRQADNEDLVYLASKEIETIANTAFTEEACVFDSLNLNDTWCRSHPNTSDANLVLKVRNDRECSEWLACEDQTLSDADNDGISETVACYSLRLCTARNEDTGECTEYKSKIDEDILTDEDDLQAISMPGYREELRSIEDYSGYAKASVEWVGACVDGYCEGGADDGSVCTTSDDCTDAEVALGYYPYDNMPQPGYDQDTDDLVDYGDFESVVCSGSAEENGSNYSSYLSYDPFLTNKLEVVRDKSLYCTLDEHCRTTETEAKMEEVIQSAVADDSEGTQLNLSAIVYEGGWCSNVDDDGDWQGGEWSTNGSAEMTIIDYDHDFDYVTTGTGIAGSYSAAEIDLNNVLFVDPEEDADAGVFATLNEGLGEGDEVTLNFDAQYLGTQTDDDRIHIGIAHGDVDTETDLEVFETGDSMADILFLVDSSGSMATYISRVASASTTLAQGLTDSGVDVRYAIATMGTPHILDFSDYTSESTYGSGDGIATGFTSSVDTFSAAMTQIASTLGGGNEHMYEALVYAANNSWADDADESGATPYELDFRPGAVRFVVLLTDEGPEEDDDYIVLSSGTATTHYADPTSASHWSNGWNNTDETNLISTLGDDPFILYTIVATDETNQDYNAWAYDELSAQYSGGIYNIDTSSYDEILTSISDSITQNTNSFAFTSTYESYSLGPITVENKDDPNDSSFLYIKQLSGGGTPFALDNVSLKPSLSVNKDKPTDYNDEVHSGIAGWLIGRQCRAYPEDSSLQCDYIEGGTIYTGWQGYCLVQDDWDKDQCAQWWPIDVIAGEPDFFTEKTEVEYGDNYPSYHCLVAKGNSDPAVCSGGTNDGLLCSSDTECPSGGTCIGNGDTFETTIGDEDPPTDDYYKTTHTYTTGDYQIKHELSKIYIDPDSAHAASVDPNDLEYAWARAFYPDDGIPVERAFHISEIEDLHFYMGTPYYPDDLNSNNGEQQAYEYGPDHMSLRYDLEYSSRFDSDVMEKSEMFVADMYGSSTAWFDDPGGVEDDPDKYPFMAYQKAAWCDTNGDDSNQEACTAGISDEAWEGVDFTFVKVIAPVTEYLDIEDLYWDHYKDSNIFEQGALRKTPETRDDENRSGEWYRLWFSDGPTSPSDNGIPNDDDVVLDLGNRGAITSVGYTGDASWADTGVPASYDQSYSYWLNQYSEEGNSYDNEYYLSDDTQVKGTKDTCWSASPCGANSFGVKFDFEDGYLGGVYLFYFNGMRRLDPEYISGAYWEISLHEPCLLAVESVDDQAGVTPWMTRVNGQSDYRTSTSNIEHNMLNSYTPYAGIPLDDSDDPGDVDYIELNDGAGGTDDIGNVTGYEDNNLPEVSISGVIGSAIPFACIGSCKDIVCPAESNTEGFRYTGTDENEDNPDYYRAYDSADSCSSGWMGVQGICLDSTGSYTNEWCDDVNDCSDTAGSCATMSINNAGISSSNDTYREQLRDAAQVAWQSYRQVFADLSETEVWFADYDDTDDRYHESHFYSTSPVSLIDGSASLNTWLLPAFDQADEDGDGSTVEDGTRDYYDMPACDGNERTNEDEYCGVRPEVEDIIVDVRNDGDYEIEDGAKVTLHFDSIADEDQQPVVNYYIAWYGHYADSWDMADEIDDLSLSPYSWDAAAADNHTHEYVYTCDPQEIDTDTAVEDGGYWDPDYVNENGSTGACVYKLKIQITDNWDWCSGQTSTDTVREVGGETCTSYDAYDGKIIVSP